MGAPVLQLRVPEDALARIDANRGEGTCSAWVLRLIGRELNGPGPRYGLRRLILCTACGAALQGRVYKRELPEGAARAVHREVRRS